MFPLRPLRGSLAAPTALVELWKRTGDPIGGMHALFAEFDLVAVDYEIGGFDSVHLYLATKPTAPTTPPRLEAAARSGLP